MKSIGIVNLGVSYSYIKPMDTGIVQYYGLHTYQIRLMFSSLQLRIIWIPRTKKIWNHLFYIFSIIQGNQKRICAVQCVRSRSHHTGMRERTCMVIYVAEILCVWYLRVFSSQRFLFVQIVEWLHYYQRWGLLLFARTKDTHRNVWLTVWNIFYYMDINRYDTFFDIRISLLMAWFTTVKADGFNIIMSRVRGWVPMLMCASTVERQWGALSLLWSKKPRSSLSI